MLLDDLNDRLERNKRDFLDVLFALIRKPSISSNDAAVRECATLLLDEIRQAGMNAELCETGGRPLIYAHRIVASQLPTILFYGHYDVVPTEPLDEWHSAHFSRKYVMAKFSGVEVVIIKGSYLHTSSP